MFIRMAKIYTWKRIFAAAAAGRTGIAFAGRIYSSWQVLTYSPGVMPVYFLNTWQK